MIWRLLMITAGGGFVVTDKEKLCMGCMSLLDANGECSYCGYNDAEPYNVDYLPPHTRLQERYIVGKLLSCNGESGYYIGYDLQEDMKVILREFAPMQIVTRNHATLAIVPQKGKETAFKNLAADFEDLCSMLQGMDGTRGISQMLDILHENGTVYAVFRYINTLPLGELITRCGGEIPWAKCKKMYLQLLNTVSQVHKRGLIHAGICPETILVDEKGNAYLSHFSLSALRYVDSEIDSELFSGYCAPEQYECSEGNASFGEWTDVYALSAILYRLITGTQPPDAPSRKQQDNLLPACELDASIAQSISDAIQAGLALPISERTSTADALAAQLLDCVQTNTAIYQSDSLNQNAAETQPEEPVLSEREQRRREKMEKKQAKRAARRKKNRRVLRSFLAVLIATILTSMGLGGFVMFYLSRNYDSIQDSVSQFVSIGDRSSSSSEPSSAAEPNRVPDLTGQLVDKITANKDYSASFDLSIVNEFNEHPAGFVFDQSPKPDTIMQNRGTVILYVSKGPETVKLPSLAGSTEEQAIEQLEEMELKYEIVYINNPNYVDGLVAYTFPAADSMVTKKGGKSDQEATVTLIIAKNSEVSSSEASSSSKSSKSSKSASRSSRSDDDN